MTALVSILLFLALLLFPILRFQPPLVGSLMQKPTLYLTFDADMTANMERKLAQKKVSAWYDPLLLQYLKSEHLPATIFVTGMFAETYPTIVRTWGTDANILLGNHTYDHAAFSAPCYHLPFLKTDDLKKIEIEKTQTILQTLTGKAPTLFRFPGLCHSAHDDQLVTASGLRVVDTDIISGDAFGTNAAAIETHVLRQVAAGKILLFHLGGPNAPKTAEVLKVLIPKLRARGFTFSTL